MPTAILIYLNGTTAPTARTYPIPSSNRRGTPESLLLSTKNLTNPNWFLDRLPLPPTSLPKQPCSYFIIIISFFFFFKSEFFSSTFTLLNVGRIGTFFSIVPPLITNIIRSPSRSSHFHRNKRNSPSSSSVITDGTNPNNQIDHFDSFQNRAVIEN